MAQPDTPAPPRGRLAALLVAVFALGVYALTLSRVVAVGDSGELMTAAERMWVAHPTGYPLFLLAAKLFSLLVPVGSVALRMNLFSAVSGAAACGLLCLLLSRHVRPAAAAAGALVLAFSLSFWSQSVMFRVYPFTLLACTAVLCVLDAWVHAARAGGGGGYAPGERRAFLSLGLLGGLSLGTHMMAGGVLAGAFVLVLWTRPRTLLQPFAWAAGALFLVGLCVYAYVPWASAGDPPLDWGDPEGFGALLKYVTRADFWGRAYVSGPVECLETLWNWAWSLCTEFGFVAVAVAVAGLGALWRRDRPRTAALLVTGVVGVLPIFLHGSRLDVLVWHRYLVLAWLVCAVFAAAGLEAAWRRRPVAAAVLAVLCVAAPLVLNFRQADRSGARIADAYTRALFETLPPGAALVLRGDSVKFPALYLYYVEGVRDDIALYPELVAAKLPPLAVNPSQGKELFFGFQPEGFRIPGMTVVPWCPGYRVIAMGEAAPEWDDPLPPEALPGLDRPPAHMDYLERNLAANYWIIRARALLFWRQDLDGARDCLARATRTAFDDADVHVQVGRVYERHGMPLDAAAAWRRARDIDWKHPAARELVRALSDREAAAELAYESYVRARNAGQSADALLALQAYMDAKPRDPWAPTAMATVLEQIGQPEPALHSLEKAAALAPGDAALHVRLGGARARHGDLEGARAAYLHAEALEPGHAGARAGLDALPAPE